MVDTFLSSTRLAFINELFENEKIWIRLMGGSVYMLLLLYMFWCFQWKQKFCAFLVIIEICSLLLVRWSLSILVSLKRFLFPDSSFSLNLDYPNIVSKWTDLKIVVYHGYSISWANNVCVGQFVIFMFLLNFTHNKRTESSVEDWNRNAVRGAKYFIVDFFFVFYCYVFFRIIFLIWFFFDPMFYEIEQ